MGSGGAVDPLTSPGSYLNGPGQGTGMKVEGVVNRGLGSEPFSAKILS